MLNGDEQASLFEEADYAAAELGTRRGGPRDPVSKPTDERYTPPDVLAVVHKLGPIALDPCTPPWNPTRAVRFVSLPRNGLAEDWLELSNGGLIYVNPPYSRGLIDEWCRKIQREARRGAEILTLTTQDLSTGWGQGLVRNGRGLCWWRGRIVFDRDDGPAFDSGAKQPSLFTYFGSRPWAFYEAFCDHGAVITRGAWA